MRRSIPPNLDDRSFGQLRADAIERIRAVCPGWTDFSPSDPGIALAEVFAYLTQTLLYRLNRVPEKQYRAFLELLGVRQLPPSAASTSLRFARAEPGGAIEIPRGTRVSAENVVFSTTLPGRLAEDSTEVEVPAFHGEAVDGELIGFGTGAPGLHLSVQRHPIVAPMGDQLDLVVGVEEIDSVPATADAVQFEGKTFRVWPEVSSFAELKDGERGYVVDRLSGLIRFPPAAEILDERGVIRFGQGAYGAVPPQGREIRASYRTGGGAQGNVRAGILTTLKDRVPGVTVTNPGPAKGGRDAESLDNLLVRGPTDFHRLERAVTARDYETLARRTGSIARAKAFTESQIWLHAPPGLVGVRIVPTMGVATHPSLDELRQQETPEELAKVEQALAAARPMGTGTIVSWTRYKPVSINLQAIVARQEDRAAVRSRILERLEQLITPLPRSAWDDGWAYGRSLRRYDVEGTVRAEPGVLYVNSIEIISDLMPGEVASLTRDLQPRTIFAGSGSSVYRTVNGGDGWELVQSFPQQPPEKAEIVVLVRSSPYHPGYVAAVVKEGNSDRRRTYLSRNCGESWTNIESADIMARDLAWSSRGGTPLLYYATDGGLFEFLLDGSASPIPVEVVAGQWKLGLSSVVTSTDTRGITFVAVATSNRTGIYLSRNGGASGSFVPLGLTKGVNELAIQSVGVRSYLWAGFADPDTGAARYELGLESAQEGWDDFINGWGDAGSCLCFGFTRDDKVVAGSHSQGVLWLNPREGEFWNRPPIECGLPLRGQQVEGEHRLFEPVPTLVVDTLGSKDEGDRILAGTKEGVFRAAAVPSKPGEAVKYQQLKYEAVTQRSRFPGWLREVVTLPPTWLFCSGRHRVDVESEDDVRDG